MKFGITAGSIGPNVDGPHAAAFARDAEAAGFESIWVSEHVILPDDYSSPYPYDPSGKIPAPADVAIPDPLIWLTYVAASTSKLRLGTSIMILPQRNPVVLAKEVATLDHMSGGRVDLGVGAGWLREEFEAIGVPWDARGKRMDEYIQAMRELWSADGATFHGDFVDFAQVHSNPKPASRSVPVHVGGSSPAAARRAGRLGDGFAPFEFSDQVPELISIMRREAEAAGRDPHSIEVTTSLPPVEASEVPATVRTLATAGVTRVLIPIFAFFGDDCGQLLREFAEKVIEPTNEVASAAQ